MLFKTAPVLCLGLVLGSAPAAAQDARALQNMFGGVIQSGISQGALGQWRQLPEAEVACIDRALRPRGASVQFLIQRGIGPSDAQLAEVRAACLRQPAPQEAAAQRPAPAGPYAVGAAAQGVVQPGPPAAARGERRLLTQIPDSCEAARQLGSDQLSIADPLSRRRSPGPACQAILVCKTDLARQTRDIYAFLRANPDVVGALRSVSPILFQNGFTGNFVRDLEGGARRLDSITPQAPCNYVWDQINMQWIDLGGKNAVAHAFQALTEGGRALFSQARSEFDAAEAEYRSLMGFNDRYAGVEQFERAYRSYADAVSADDIAGIVRERKVFLGVMDGAKARRLLLEGQSAELSRLTTSLADTTAACDRDGLADFSKQDIFAALAALKAETEGYTGRSPAQRGDVSSGLKVLAVRHQDLQNLVRAARSEKARIEEFRLMLAQRETVARQLADVAARDDLKGGLDQQFLRSANEAAERLRQFSLLDLKVIRERENELGETLRQLTGLEQRLQDAKVRYAEARDREERRRAAVEQAGFALAQFSGPAGGRLTAEAGPVLTGLGARRDVLARLDGIRLLDRPDYAADLAAAEDAIAQLGRTRAELDEVDRLAADLAALKAKIDARGRRLLDAATASDLDGVDKAAAPLAGARVPLAPEARGRLEQVRSRLDRLANSVDAVMDMGALDPESRVFLMAHPEFRAERRVEDSQLLVLYGALAALDYCNAQSWFGMGDYRQTAAEARRRVKILEDIALQIHHQPKAEIDRFKAAMDVAKEEIQHKLKWDRDAPPGKACDEFVMMLQLKQPW